MSKKILFPEIKNICDKLVSEFGEIPSFRKELLKNISRYIFEKHKSGQPVSLVYVCTHNSRRSHFGQIWAAVAATYFGVRNVETFSGGTETTAFNINAINSLKRMGFEVISDNQSDNPVYKVRYGEGKFTTCFSKVYNHTANPAKSFAAIMTCSDAEENCPFIPGVELRVGTAYDDPKAFDNTNLRDQKYDERSRQIAIETLFVFSQIEHMS
ncbi:MAG: protein-tyrosine-phosphatase [Flavobacteriales bacterium]